MRRFWKRSPEVLTVADEIEIAGEYTQRKTDERTSLIRAQVQGEGQEHCEDCGLDLTPERRAAAPWAIRCVPCADLLERKSGGYRRG